MSAKQDRVSARTPVDLERKYNFGESFAKAMGLAEDAKKAADVAKKAADDALALDGELDQEEVFNRLTNDGEVKGLFMENGQLYINADYLKSGKISADVIDGSQLNVSGTVKIRMYDSYTGEYGYVTVDESGMVVSSEDYEPGRSGSAMMYGNGIIQHVEGDNFTPLIFVGNYERPDNFKKVLLGSWVIEGIESPTITTLEATIAALEQRIYYLESLMGLHDE